MKCTQYFLAIRQRPDCAIIRDEWIQHVVAHPSKEVIQADGRIRRWAAIREMDGRYLRFILLADGQTVHNCSAPRESSGDLQSLWG
jgi:hypothetical protein